MRSKYVAPEFNKAQFHCMHCGVFARQDWYDAYLSLPRAMEPNGFRACRCFHCGDYSHWYNGKLVVPASAPVEPCHPDLPDDCHEEFDEAREIFARSPRAAAALLRLCIQKLMPHLGESGKNINADIGSLVAKGLPPVVQQALDICRVVGNNAVHPGEIDLNDTPEIAHQLFAMINFIVEDRITRPREVATLYQQLPQTALQQIQQRNQKALAATSSASPAPAAALTPGPAPSASSN